MFLSSQIHCRFKGGYQLTNKPLLFTQSQAWYHGEEILQHLYQPAKAGSIPERCLNFIVVIFGVINPKLGGNNFSGNNFWNQSQVARWGSEDNSLCGITYGIDGKLVQRPQLGAINIEDSIQIRGSNLQGRTQYPFWCVLRRTSWKPFWQRLEQRLFFVFKHWKALWKQAALRNIESILGSHQPLETKDTRQQRSM